MVTKHYLRVWLFAFVLFMSLKIASADKNKTINQDSTHGPISDVTSVIDTIIKAKWLNNAISAFTFTWDDNNYSHQQVGQILDSYGFKSSFFVNPGFANWETIKPIYVELSNNNHEIGNHTWSHLNLTTLSQEELAFQIIAPIEEITNSIGKQPVSFVQPFNASNPEVDSIVFEHHLFSRIRSQYTQQNRIKKGPISTHTLIDFQNWINESIESNKWLIIGAHGIDGFGWEPITSDLLEQVCQILEENQPSIWVGTLKEIAAYEYLKEELTIDYSIESDMLTINIEGLDHQKYNLLDSLPFTVLVSMDKCKKLVNIDSDITEVVPKPNAEDDLKQYAVTFDVKNAQHIQLRVEPEVSVFNIIGDEGYCEGEPGVTIGLNGSETNIWYYLIHNQSDTVAYQEGNSEFLFLKI